jgi:hypothetical protein
MATSYQHCCTGDLAQLQDVVENHGALDRDALIRWSTESPAGGSSLDPGTSIFCGTAFGSPQEKPTRRLFDYLLEMGWGCDIQAFNNAIDSGSTEVVQMFIDKHPSLIAYVGPHNKTYLNVALNGYMPRKKTVPMVRLLLANGANPNKLTPLIRKAASSSYPKAVEELKGHKAQPPKVDFLRTAIYGGSLEMVRQLADSVASSRERRHRGLSPRTGCRSNHPRW